VVNPDQYETSKKIKTEAFAILSASVFTD